MASKSINSLKMNKVAIVILNYRGFKNTIECISSVKSLKKTDFKTEIIVIDNDSQDASKKELKKIKGITFIVNTDNMGYSGGNNLGINYALKKAYQYVLILNNDTTVNEYLLINLLLNSKNADIVAPKIYFAPGNEYHKGRYKKDDSGKVIWYAGGEIDWNNIVGNHIGVDEVDIGQFNNKKETDYATGACMLVSRKVFEKIGCFDEKYFLYLEDMDFCYRAKKAGFKIIFEPRAVLWHKNAQSAGGSGSSLQDYYITRNRLLFAFKFAKLKTKLAVLKQAILQIKNRTKRKALFDFLTLKFYKGNTK